MEKSKYVEPVTWPIERLDNGITIEDSASLSKEAAVEGSAPDE